MHPKKDVIYIVDDDDIYQYAIKKKILKRKLSATVNTFKNGHDAINYLSRVVEKGAEPLPDMILLDLNMPVMDGWDFLDQYARLQPRLKKEIKLYVISSSIQASDIDRARGISDVTDYIVKPIDDQQLDNILVSAHTH